MRRGEIYTAAARGAYTGKPRPVVIVQDDHFDATASVTVCPLTSDPAEAPLIRLPLAATASTGITQPSRMMVDKLTTMPRGNLRERLGRVPETDMVQLSRALMVFLGLAS